MQADAVDAETARTGVARTGLYFALWGLATKLAVALAAVGLPLAALAGFRPEGPNGPEALTALALLYGPLPVAFKLAAVALMWRHPLTRAVQAENRRRIAAGRREGCG
ncbi:MAG TPA: MFS transporter, partial [Azospirillaceae bacterium]|nr:MFS transporter [Azospirillaceae bacterium]